MRCYGFHWSARRGETRNGNTSWAAPRSAVLTVALAGCAMATEWKSQHWVKDATVFARPSLKLRRRSGAAAALAWFPLHWLRDIVDTVFILAMSSGEHFKTSFVLRVSEIWFKSFRFYHRADGGHQLRLMFGVLWPPW